MLTQQFGDAFREHQKHAGFLFPRFRSRSEDAHPPDSIYRGKFSES
jgi:hypothetical protein